MIRALWLDDIILETSRLGGIRELRPPKFQKKRSVTSGPATEFTLALGAE